MDDKTNKKGSHQVGEEFFAEFWEESWTYIKTVVDVLREPVLILDKNLCVLAANEPFYRLFQVEQKDTEGQVVYKLGNGQWDIPALRKLLEDILPKNTFFRGFEVDHEFPYIGHRTIVLNARHISSKNRAPSERLPAIIMLAMEDVTEIMAHLGSTLPFLMTLSKDDYQYLGDGKSLDDKRCIVFWYRNEDTKLRAIYNDLSVADVQEKDIP